MSVFVDGLLFGWQKNLDYGQRLLSDLSDDQMVLQPVADGVPANHPAWAISHLNVYVPIIESLILGEAFPDPKEHRYGMQSRPQASREEYPSREELLNAWTTGHERVTSALRERGESALSQPVKLDRWQETMPAAGIALPYLMLVHENQHLGQVSAWRRVLGLPSV